MKEQANDDSKKEYCETSRDQTDDEKKGVQQSISAIEEMEGSIAKLTEEIGALEARRKASNNQSLPLKRWRVQLAN